MILHTNHSLRCNEAVEDGTNFGFANRRAEVASQSFSAFCRIAAQIQLRVNTTEYIPIPHRDGPRVFDEQAAGILSCVQPGSVLLGHQLRAPPFGGLIPEPFQVQVWIPPIHIIKFKIVGQLGKLAPLQRENIVVRFGGDARGQIRIHQPSNRKD